MRVVGLFQEMSNKLNVQQENKEGNAKHTCQASEAENVPGGFLEHS